MSLKNSNTMLSKLNNKQKEELLDYLDEFEFKYLPSINLPNNLNFGIEIESENGNKSAIRRIMKDEYNAFCTSTLTKKKDNDYSRWQISNDGSLDNGIELSSPIFKDEKETWIEIKNVCEMLKNNNAVATNKTGAHVHFNISFLGNDCQNYIRLFKLYTIYENILIKFGYGETKKARPGLFKYAKPCSQKLYKEMYFIENAINLSDLGMWLYYEKHTAMNLRNTNFNDVNDERKNTIEFRSANGTINYIIWQNIINTYGHLFMSAKNTDLDMEFLDYKLKTYYEKKCNMNNFYDKTFLKSALEFVDIIFDNNYDKLMFLKQYLSENDSIKLKEKVKTLNCKNRLR